MANYLINQVQALVGPVTFPSVPGLGVQLPSNAVELPHELPEPESGCVWAWIDNAPVQLPDRRGAIYHIQTGTLTQWTELGELPVGFTDKPWPGKHFIWVEGDWKLDEEAKSAAESKNAQAERDSRLREASLRIAPLQYALELGEASSEEQSALLEWKRYCVALNRIEQQPGYPLEIEWPVLTLDAPRGRLNALRSFFRAK